MRIFIFVLLIAVTTFNVHAESLNVWNRKIEFKTPSSLWKEENRVSEPTKGMVMYKREAIKDKDGLVVQPVMSIVYEKTPENIKNIDDFVQYAREATPYKVETAIQLPNGTIVFFCSYDAQGIRHSLTIGHLYNNGIGIQAISDTTISLLDNISDDQKLFIGSVSFNKD